MTVREMVREMQAEILKSDLQPHRQRELLAKLSALIGNCNEEIRKADAAYSAVLLEMLNGNEAANRARIRAEITPEFARRCEARDTKELVVELVRSLKYMLKSLDEEMRLSR